MPGLPCSRLWLFVSLIIKGQLLGIRSALFYNRIQFNLALPSSAPDRRHGNNGHHARYYRYQRVTDYLKGKRCRIRLHFLPPYSPNLNLIERLWGLLKREVIYNRYYEKFAHFKMAVMDFFRHTEQYAEKIQSLMVENFGIMKT